MKSIEINGRPAFEHSDRCSRSVWQAGQGCKWQQSPLPPTPFLPACPPSFIQAAFGHLGRNLQAASEHSHNQLRLSLQARIWGGTRNVQSGSEVAWKVSIFFSPPKTTTTTTTCLQNFWKCYIYTACLSGHFASPFFSSSSFVEETRLRNNIRLANKGLHGT